MPRALLVAFFVLLAQSHAARAQVSGASAFREAGGQATAEQHQRDLRVLGKYDVPPTDTSTFVEANVLLNAPADEYVAIFGVMQEGATVAECLKKMDATLAAFSKSVAALGVKADEISVDFIAQNKIYGFEIVEDIAREKLVGFELKKNVAIRYRDKALLDRLVASAAESQIFDLVKVDYVLADLDGIQDRLMAEAARIVQRKVARYEKLLGVVSTQPQVYAERPAIYYPSELYDSYTAFESEEIDNSYYRQKYATQTMRKSKTFFYNGLDASSFDAVLNPVVTEPAVQCTLYLKLKYEIAPAK